VTELSHWLPFLAPPLLGALIGYLTNYIAIRMLFRPLRPWSFLGMRLPLTPGIIPAKRKELAKRMGQMVGSHLLTADDVSQVLRQSRFRQELKHAVNEKLSTFLDRELGSIESLVPENYRSRFRELANILRWRAVALVMDYVSSAEFERGLRGYLRQTADNVLSRDLESFLTPERYAAMQGHLENRFRAFLAAPETANVVGRFIETQIDNLLQSSRPIRDWLPDDLIDVLLEQIEKEMPQLLERFGGLLYDPEFRQRLVIKIQEAIKGFIDSLGGLAGLLSGFINMEQLYAKIPDFLDRTGEELARWLREERTQRQVASMLRERLETIIDRPLGSYLEKLPYEKVTSIRRFIRERGINVVQSRRSAELLLTATEKSVQHLKDRSFQSLCDQILPEDGLDQIKVVFEDYLLAKIRSNEARDALDRVFKEHLDLWLVQRPVGRLAARLPADARAELEDGFCHLVEELLQREVPPLIDTLDVASMVEAKVNQLDILQVEDLLMGIMKEQFKYINLFGAMLGFLIGLVNLLVWQFA
jgi:uncharacterized membrane protein YheB (UPF0754 family)